MYTRERSIARDEFPQGILLWSLSALAAPLSARAALLLLGGSRARDQRQSGG